MNKPNNITIFLRVNYFGPQRACKHPFACQNTQYRQEKYQIKNNLKTCNQNKRLYKYSLKSQNYFFSSITCYK